MKTTDFTPGKHTIAIEIITNDGKGVFRPTTGWSFEVE
jgi:hypothetical protein